MNETRKQTFERLKTQLQQSPSDDIPLPSVVAAVEFRREQYGLRQAEWAILLGMGKTHYSEFVHGKKSLPTYAGARVFKLGVPAEVILQLDEPVEFKEIKISDRYGTGKMTPLQLREYNRDAKRRSRARSTSDVPSPSDIAPSAPFSSSPEVSR